MGSDFWILRSAAPEPNTAAVPRNTQRFEGKANTLENRIDDTYSVSKATDPVVRRDLLGGGDLT